MYHLYTLHYTYNAEQEAITLTPVDDSEEMVSVLCSSVMVAQGNQGVWCPALLGWIMAKQGDVM